MSRSVLAQLAAIVVATPLQADSTSRLFVVEQERAALVSRLTRQWSDAFAPLPGERRRTHEQLGVGDTFAIASQSILFTAMALLLAVPETDQQVTIMVVLGPPLMVLFARLGLNCSGRHFAASLKGG